MADAPIGLDMLSEPQFALLAKLARKGCPQEYHASIQTLSRGLDVHWGGNVIRDEIRALERDGILYNYGGHSYALTKMGAMFCRLIREELQRELGFRIM